MTKKIIIMVLLPSIFLYLTGCYSMYDIPKEESKTLYTSKLWVLTNNGDSYLFQDHTYIIRKDTLFGKINYENQPSINISIPLKNISSMQTEKINGGSTVLAVLGGVVILAGVAVLLGGLFFGSLVSGSVH
jgi:hypothetical protein